MIYRTLKIGEIELQLRLTTFQSKKLVESTKKTALELMHESGIRQDVTIMLPIIVHAVIQKIGFTTETGIEFKIEDAYNLYDNMIDHEFGLTHLLALTKLILRDAGIIGKKLFKDEVKQLGEMGIIGLDQYTMTDDEEKELLKPANADEADETETKNSLPDSSQA